MITIRNEEERDYKVVEEITRKAFYTSIYPGMRNIIRFTSCADMRFYTRADFVIELDGQVIGNIMYTKARLVDEAEQKRNP